MFGIGFGELVLVFIVMLLVFGPDKLPEVAKNAAKFWRNLQKLKDGAKQAFEAELNEPIKQNVNEVLNEFKQASETINKNSDKNSSKNSDLESQNNNGGDLNKEKPQNSKIQEQSAT